MRISLLKKYEQDNDFFFLREVYLTRFRMLDRISVGKNEGAKRLSIL